MRHRIEFTSSGSFTKHFFLKRRVKSAVCRTLKYEKVDVPCLISVLFTDGPGIRAINSEFRKKDAETDVLSFPANEFEPGRFDTECCEYDRTSGKYILGDIVISVPRCELQGREFGHSVYREVEYLTVHSMLHLLGYDHIDEGEMKKQMRSREKNIMGNQK